MQRRFEGRSFMVTGAGTGFGAALAERAAQEGAAAVLDPLPQLVGRAPSRPPSGSVRRAPRPSSSRATSPRGRTSSGWPTSPSATFGGIDVLINNVGDMASGQASWTEVTEEAIDHVLAVDIKGTMLMVHEFGQRMVERGGGAIVNVGSTVIVRGSPRAPAVRGRQVRPARGDQVLRQGAGPERARQHVRPRLHGDRGAAGAARVEAPGGARSCCPGRRLGRFPSRRT